MLAELEPTATELAVARRARRGPSLSDLRAAAPGVRALAADFDPLNDAARPALVRLADMSKTGRRAVRAATPIADLLQPVAAPPAGRRRPTATALVESLRDRGAVEGLQGYATTARWRQPASTATRTSCRRTRSALRATCRRREPAPGCDAHFAGSTANPGETNDRAEAPPAEAALRGCRTGFGLRERLPLQSRRPRAVLQGAAAPFRQGRSARLRHARSRPPGHRRRTATSAGWTSYSTSSSAHESNQDDRSSLVSSPILVGAVTVLVGGHRGVPVVQRELGAAVRPDLRGDRPGAGRGGARRGQRGADRRQARRRGQGDRRQAAARRAAGRRAVAQARPDRQADPRRHRR